MQASRPLLTIAIPTYNRSRFLTDLLSSLFEQCLDQPDVELLVSDNASEDDTPVVIDQYQRYGLPINYIRNIVNVGPDANFLQCFYKAAGKYVWIIGDDDIVTASAIKTILTWLKQNHYSLIYVSPFAFRALSDRQRPKSFRQPTVTQDAAEFARQIHVNFTFISGVIVNKARLTASEMESFSNLVGTNLVQLSWTYAALNRFESGLVIHERLVGMRTNNTGGYALAEVFGPRLNSVTKRCLQSDRVSRCIINGTLTRFMPDALLGLRRLPHQFSDAQDPDKILRPVFGRNWRYHAFIIPILQLPTSLAEIWFFMIRIVNKVDKNTGSLLIR